MISTTTRENLRPEEIVAMIRKYFESLPADRFPNTGAVGTPLRQGGPDERFELGLDVIIRSLASYERKYVRRPDGGTGDKRLERHPPSGEGQDEV